MTLPSWPTVLPRPERSGYESRLEDPRLRRATGSGPPGYRRRWSSVARTVRMTIEVPRADRSVFDLFFEDTTAMGSLPFLMPDPTTDGWAALTGGGVPILTEDGSPILLAAQWVCLFGSEMPAVTARGIRFRIAFSVSVMP